MVMLLALALNQDQGETDMKVQPVELEIVLSKSRSSKGLEFDIRTDREERSLFLIGSTRPLEIASMNLEDRSTLMRYSLRQLQVFLATAKTENISVAAGQLAMSQSAASGSLGELEKNFDVQLFERIGKRLRLSEFGAQLRPKAENLLEQAQEFEQAMAGDDAIDTF